MGSLATEQTFKYKPDNRASNKAGQPAGCGNRAAIFTPANPPYVAIDLPCDHAVSAEQNNPDGSWLFWLHAAYCSRTYPAPATITPARRVSLFYTSLEFAFLAMFSQIEVGYAARS